MDDIRFAFFLACPAQQQRSRGGNLIGVQAIMHEIAYFAFLVALAPIVKLSLLRARAIHEL